MAKSHKTVPSGSGAAGGSNSTNGSGGGVSTKATQNIQVTAAQTPQGAQAYTNAYQAAIANGATKQQALQQGMAAQNAADAAQLQQQSAQQAQQQNTTAAQPQATTAANATSSNVKAYFGNNNGGFKDVKDLVANQSKIESWLDSAAKNLTGDKTPQWLAAEAMGYNAKPNVVPTLTSLPNQGNRVVMYRGVAGDSAYAQQFKTGDNYPGVGIYGDGTYFQLSYSGAQSYANTSNKAHVISCSVDMSKIRVISEPKLRKMRDNLVKSSKCSQQVKDLIYNNAMTTKSGTTKYPSNSRGSRDSSLGTFATLLGYDAIYVPGGNGGTVAKNQPTNAGKNNDFYVILNRGAVDVKAGY